MRAGRIAVAFSLFVAACSSSEPTSPYSTNTTPTDTTGVIQIDPSGSANTGTQTTGWVSKSLVDGGVTYNYKVWVPANYNSVSKVPVLLALHGSGGKGNDNVSQTTQGVGVVIRSNPNFPALVVFPQGPAGEGPTRSTFVRISQTALAQTLNEYGKRDLTRVYITGLSYGAIQSWEIAYKNPNLFAGSLEISGNLCAICMFGTSSTDAQATATVAPVIKTLPVWLFQGDQDTQVPVTSTRILVAALKAVGSPIIYTEIAGGDHALWDGVYARADVWTWLWAQHR